MTAMEIKENPSGIDMGGRYRVYEWYDDQWNGSGTQGPFDQKQAAIDGVDRIISMYPDDHLCVVDRVGNIVYQAGNTDHDQRPVIYLAFYRFPEEGWHWTFAAPFKKRKDAKEHCEDHWFNKNLNVRKWRDADPMSDERPNCDYLDTGSPAGVEIIFQIREETLL